MHFNMCVQTNVYIDLYIPRIHFYSKVIDDKFDGKDKKII